MGTALRQLHAVRLPAYGRFGANGLDAPVTANIDAVRARAAHGLARFRHFGAPEALAARIETTLDRHAGLATWSAGAVFAHDDFHPNNVLVLRDGTGRLRLSGIIDFGDAFAGDAVSDLAKTLFCCEHDAPGSTPAILQGYGLVEHPNPALALWFYTMLHRVTVWWWLRQVGVIGQGEAHPLLADLEAMGTSRRLRSPASRHPLCSCPEVHRECLCLNFNLQSRQLATSVMEQIKNVC